MLRGAAAGAAGTTALNAVTYLDMAWRARPASSTPSDSVDEAVARMPVDAPGQGDDRDNRISAVGELTGLATVVTAYAFSDAASWAAVLQDLRRARGAARGDQPDQSCRRGLAWLVQGAGRGDEEAFGNLTDVLLPWVWTTVAGRARPDRLTEVSAAGRVLMWQRSPQFDASQERVMHWAQACAEDALAADEEILGRPALTS
jgi:hypothetical protein